jgi:hypothetical protein
VAEGKRAFRTLQDRLPKELALAGITTAAAANRWLAETYWPELSDAPSSRVPPSPGHFRACLEIGGP